MIILYSSNPNVYVTDDTNQIQIKHPVPYIQQFIDKDVDNNKFQDLNCYFQVKTNSTINLLNKANIHKTTNNTNEQAIDHINTIYKYSKLISQHSVFGMVIKNWSDIQQNKKDSKIN